MQNQNHSAIDSIPGAPVITGLPRLLFMVLGFALLCSGCDGLSLSRYKFLPAPLAESLPYEIEGARSMKISGGDNFEINDNGVVHFLVLEGIDSPKPGQDFYSQSRRYLIRKIRFDEIRVVVVGRDNLMREIAQIYVDEKNINLVMVKAGMAWWDGSEFEGVDEIKSAESAARKSKRGLWKNPDAIHPSEFERSPIIGNP